MEGNDWISLPVGPTIGNYTLMMRERERESVCVCVRQRGAGLSERLAPGGRVDVSVR